MPWLPTVSLASGWNRVNPLNPTCGDALDSLCLLGRFLATHPESTMKEHSAALGRAVLSACRIRYPISVPAAALWSLSVVG